MKLSLWRAPCQVQVRIQVRVRVRSHFLSLSCVFITASGIKCKTRFPPSFPRGEGHKMADAVSEPFFLEIALVLSLKAFVLSQKGGDGVVGKAHKVEIK